MIQLEYPTEVDGGGGDAERRLGRRDADQTVALVARQRFGRRRGAPARHRLDRRVHQAHDADFDVGVGVGQRSTHLVLAAGADVRQPQELHKKNHRRPVIIILLAAPRRYRLFRSRFGDCIIPVAQVG